MESVPVVWRGRRRCRDRDGLGERNRWRRDWRRESFDRESLVDGWECFDREGAIDDHVEAVVEPIERVQRLTAQSSPEPTDDEQHDQSSAKRCSPLSSLLVDDRFYVVCHHTPNQI